MHCARNLIYWLFYYCYIESLNSIIQTTRNIPNMRPSDCSPILSLSLLSTSEPLEHRLSEDKKYRQDFRSHTHSNTSSHVFVNLIRIGCVTILAQKQNNIKWASKLARISRSFCFCFCFLVAAVDVVMCAPWMFSRSKVENALHFVCLRPSKSANRLALLFYIWREMTICA